MTEMRQLVVGALVTLGTAAISAYGVYLANSVAAVSEAVAEVHTLANSNLAAANSRLDDALAQIAELNRLVLELSSRPPEEQP